MPGKIIKERPSLHIRSIRKLTWPFYAVSFLVIGGIVLFVSGRASSPYTSLIARSAALASPARVVADSTAADGVAVVQFGSTINPSPTPLPSPGTWTNATSNLAGLASECGNMTSVSSVPGSDIVIAGIAQQGLWSNTTGTTSWTRIGSGSGSAVITNRPMWIVYDPTNPAIFWEAGIYNGGGVYKTTNGGSTFTQLGNIGHIDYVSVDFTDPNRQTLLAGGHESAQTVYKSTNGGQTWTNIGTSLPAGTGFSNNPLVINSQTYLANTNTSWGGGSPGIYRTTNGGPSWTKVSSLDASKPPLVTTTGIIYYSSGDGLARSSDSGITWTKVGSGLRYEVNPIELPDGRLVSIGGNSLVVSANDGGSWTSFGATLPFSPIGVIYSATRQAFYIWQFDCGNKVLPNAIMKLQ